ncbi:MAG: riboflavin biosynthesis protein RibF [Clostridia bacterium]|nr:riboflavin biosynthesis protein RibF [Clostridia bacterium]
MQIVNLIHPGEPVALDRGCGLCLGHFDGVHRGHRALIEELRRLNGKRREPLPLGAMCFRTPPTATLSAHPTPQLTTLEQKLALLRDAGLSFAVLYDFPTIKDFSPEEFIIRVLFCDCDARLVVCGFNYTFGARGAGTPETLRRYYASHTDRTLSVVPAFTVGELTVSSSRIRALLESGHPEDAVHLLGHPYAIEGTVVAGKQMGRRLQAPTANLTFPRYALVPAHGVYITTATVEGRTYPAITNVGVRPTFEDDGKANCETYLLDFEGTLYDKHVKVAFLRFLRPERRFDSKEALQAQIAADVAAAREYHRTHGK